MSKHPKSKKVDSVIIVAIIGLIGTIISAILSSPALVANIQSAPSLTLTAPTPSLTIFTPTQISMQSPTETGIPKAYIPFTGTENPNKDPLDSIIKYNTNWNSLSSLIEFPNDINPEAYPEESLNKVLGDLNTIGIDKNWKPISSRFELTVNIQNMQEENGFDIKVENEVRITIAEYNKNKLYVHALLVDGIPITAISMIPDVPEIPDIPNTTFIPVTGGMTNYSFSPVLIDSIKKKYATTLEEFSFVKLVPKEFGAFKFLFNCKDPGIYKLGLEIKIFYAGESYNILLFSPYLNCPESYTSWHLQSDETGLYRWENLGNYRLRNGEYSPIP